VAEVRSSRARPAIARVAVWPLSGGIPTWRVHCTAARLLRGPGVPLDSDRSAVQLFWWTRPGRVELIDGFPERLAVPHDLPPGRMTVRLQHPGESGCANGYRRHRRMALVDQLPLSPRATTGLGRGRALAADTDRIAPVRGERQDGFPTELAVPVITKGVAIAEALPTG
jgi:hypothetical protein